MKIKLSIVLVTTMQMSLSNQHLLGITGTAGLHHSAVVLQSHTKLY